MVTKVEGLSLTKSHVPLIMWSRDVKCYITNSMKKYIQTWQKVHLGFGAPNHMSLDHVVTGCHVTNQKHYIPISTRPTTSKLDRVVILGDGLSHIKSYDSFLTSPREVTWKITNVVSPLPQTLWLPNLQGPRFKVRGSQLPSHITIWL